MSVGTSTFAFAISAIMISTTPLAARAQTPTVDVTSAPGKVRASGTVKMTATVLSIDMGSRDVLLMDSQGKLHTVNVSDQARNLDQVRVGDKVTAEYTEAISLRAQEARRCRHCRCSAGERAGGDGPHAQGCEAGRGRRSQSERHRNGHGGRRQRINLSPLRGPLGNEYDIAGARPSTAESCKERRRSRGGLHRGARDFRGVDAELAIAT